MGILQPDGTLLTRDKLKDWVKEMKKKGEYVLIDGTYTLCPKPGKWAAQKLFYDPKHKACTTNVQSLTTATGDLLAVHGGWPGSVP